MQLWSWQILWDAIWERQPTSRTLVTAAEIHGTEWQMHESEMVQVEPAAIDLRAYMRGMEHDYLLQRSKIEQIVARNPVRRLGTQEAGKAA